MLTKLMTAFHNVYEYWIQEEANLLGAGPVQVSYAQSNAIFGSPPDNRDASLISHSAGAPSENREFSQVSTS